MSEQFVEITHKDKDTKRENAWFKHCQKHMLPFITVRARGKLANVQWDYISFPPSIDSELFAAEAQIHRAVNQIYVAHRTERSSASLGPGVITLYNLGTAEAREAAGLLYDIIQKATASLSTQCCTNT